MQAKRRRRAAKLRRKGRVVCEQSNVGTRTKERESIRRGQTIPLRARTHVEVHADGGLRGLVSLRELLVQRPDLVALLQDGGLVPPRVRPQLLQLLLHLGLAVGALPAHLLLNHPAPQTPQMTFFSVVCATVEYSTVFARWYCMAFTV